jgi:hypothetical protein
MVLAHRHCVNRQSDHARLVAHETADEVRRSDDLDVARSQPLTGEVADVVCDDRGRTDVDRAEVGGRCSLPGRSGVEVEAGTVIGGRPAIDQDYSTRIPEIALAITSCWISLVPSKIVWFTNRGFLGADA